MKILAEDHPSWRPVRGVDGWAEAWRYTPSFSNASLPRPERDPLPPSPPNCATPGCGTMCATRRHRFCVFCRRTKARLLAELRPAFFRFRQDWIAQGFKCAYAYPTGAHLRSPDCPGRLQMAGSHLDHIRPKATFPQLIGEATNWQVLCAACNGKKGAKYVQW